MKKTYSSVRGTCDFSPSQTYLFNTIIQKARRIFGVFGFDEIILPILEEEGVFIRSVGETTDIVEKQIFRVYRRSESEERDNIVLRPEGTAQAIRHYVENSLFKQSEFYKFCYFGPMFRGERPQRGRLRQFNHIGAEAIGSASVFLDAEIISLSLMILDAVGIKENRLQINSLGCAADKEKYKTMLKKDLSEHKNHLCEDCKRRIEKNPLRVFDCKHQECKKITEGFGDITGTDYLCASCLEDFERLLKILKEDFGISPCLNFRLVRGLDYYTNTVFEITSDALGAQNALGAGGRYNNLVEELGGPDIPAIGFALGVERIMLALNAPEATEPIKVFVATTGENLLGEGSKLLQLLRKEGISCDIDYCGKSLKGQLRYAEKEGAKFVVIIGESELKEGFYLLKDMQSSTQENIRKEDLLTVLKKHLNKEL